MEKEKLEEWKNRFKELQDSKPKKPQIPKNVKCTCGHTAKHHFKGGWCNECGCTWFYPNDKWILMNNKRKSQI